MKDWIQLITLLMAVTIVLIMISSLYGCSTFNVARETAKVIDIFKPDKKETEEIKVTDLEPLNPEQQYNERMKREREFICTKIACADEVEEWEN